MCETMKNIITVRPMQPNDLPAAAAIWNQVVEDGIAFPQMETLDLSAAETFFGQQDLTAVAELDGKVVGLYILHPNNVGRCGHICNASYAVASRARGRGLGEALVRHCLDKAKELGFGILQFNAVVSSNTPALNLYRKLGFTQLGTIPGGFLMKDGSYQDIIPHYKKL